MFAQQRHNLIVQMLERQGSVAVRELPSLVRASPATIRRDLDLLAETDRPDELVERFTTLGSVDAVLAKGPHKAAARLREGHFVDYKGVAELKWRALRAALSRMNGG